MKKFGCFKKKGGEAMRSFRALSLVFVAFAAGRFSPRANPKRAIFNHHQYRKANSRGWFTGGPQNQRTIQLPPTRLWIVPNGMRMGWIDAISMMCATKTDRSVEIPGEHHGSLGAVAGEGPATFRRVKA